MMKQLKEKYKLKDGDKLTIPNRFYNPYTVQGNYLLNDMGNHSQFALYQIYNTGKFEMSE